MTENLRSGGTGVSMQVLRSFWWLIASTTLLGVIAGVIYGLSQPPHYASTADAYLQVESAENINDLSQLTTYRADQAMVYAKAGTSTVVLDRVSERLDIGLSGSQLAGLVTVEADSEAPVLSVTAHGKNAEDSRKLAQLTLAELTDYVAESEPKISDQPALVLVTAQEASEPVSTSITVPVVAGFGGAIGLFLGLAVAYGLAVRR